MRIFQIIKRKPWLLIIALFVVLISAWSCWISIAIKHRPEEVPLVEVDEGREKGE